MLLDAESRRLEIDLLNDVGQVPVATQATAAAGAGVQRVDEEGLHLLAREGSAFVFRMPGLAAALAPVLTGWTRRWWRLDEVGGGRLGGSRGILAGSGQLLLQTRHGSGQSAQGGALLLQQGALLVQLRLQQLAAGTGSSGCSGHASCSRALLPARLAVSGRGYTNEIPWRVN
jgi:hypothetical protein